MAEARAKKERAEKHAKEAAELLDKAVAQEVQAAQELDDAKAAAKAGGAPASPDTAASVAAEVYAFMAQTATVDQEGNVKLGPEAAAAMARRLQQCAAPETPPAASTIDLTVNDTSTEN
eukprot:2761902-Lingulodinium_polyedra.AAC.1